MSGDNLDVGRDRAEIMGTLIGILSQQDLRIPDDLSQTLLDVPLASRPSIRGVPQLHGSR